MEERKMVLKMIEDGKITAEEGLQLLQAMRDEPTEKKSSDLDKKEKRSRYERRGPHSNTGKYKKDPEANKKETDHYMSKDVNWDAQGYRKTGEKITTFASRFSEFVEDAVHKIKEFDLDFNFGSSVEVQHIFQEKNITVEDIGINIENGSIVFRPWEEDDVRVECNVKVYKVSDTDEARRVFLDEAGFSLNDDKLRLHAKKKSMKVNATVYVPKHNLKKIQFYAFNGKISGENVSVESLEAKTVNGRINFEEIEAKDVRLETVNGTISVSRLEADLCDTKTVNGTIAIKTAKGDFDGETLNGTVYYTLLEPESARAYIKTATGSVEVTVPDNVKTEGELKTTVGGIQCDLPELTVIDEKKDFASKKMTFLANKNQEAHFYIEAEATTGAISIKN
ncbi:DUF4097 domain-containing protein [Salipaludibacillus neizhouensis]|uniref:DUF4097 domain-containing protein n=1 Tax=Salipaludibacillus neizhouensis TaxID=885475 RepID=A0A3A9KUW3_9BACI|nr:DUF4097 domain-containing protein [Salipaludibacillus neizhouensis]RKL68396.1 DUF4097 domain-containing protein [Salipaludibacillus neizhouensis]